MRHGWHEFIKFLEDEFSVHFLDNSFALKVSGSLKIETKGDDINIEFTKYPGISEVKISGGLKSS